MKGVSFFLGMISALWASVSPSFAEQETSRTNWRNGAPLLLEDVLSASVIHYPKILETMANERVAAGNALRAVGAFDTIFTATGQSRLSGYYDGTTFDAGLTKRLRPLNAKVYSGWRVSRGEFPLYEDDSYTNRLGEAKIGVALSLLRDRAIDADRLKLIDASLGVTAAEIDALMARIAVQHSAISAYWGWVAAGRQLEIYENLLKIAEARQSGLEEQVRKGARARIYLTENAQNITRRQILAAQAQRALEQATNSLSLYYRDEFGTPIIAQRNSLPNQAEIVEPAPRSDMTRSETSPMIADRRPEVSAILNELARAQAALKAAENELQPRLDLQYEISNDFGAIAEGGPTRDGVDNVVGIRFTAPFGRTTARGMREKARAEIDALLQRERLTREQIAVEIENIRLERDVARQLAALATKEVEQSKILEEAERKRFASGASDFFLVNLREETAADAELKLVDADLARRRAQAALDAATMNLAGLGLTEADG
ncbi:MAG: TolC family protein [Amphiplicatus sp.]|nr:TolC family protein [Amphiplicatus sp.]